MKTSASFIAVFTGIRKLEYLILNYVNPCIKGPVNQSGNNSSLNSPALDVRRWGRPLCLLLDYVLCPSPTSVQNPSVFVEVTWSVSNCCLVTNVKAHSAVKRLWNPAPCHCHYVGGNYRLLLPGRSTWTQKGDLWVGVGARVAAAGDAVATLLVYGSNPHRTSTKPLKNRIFF